MTLVRSQVINLKMTVRDDCAVSACSPPPVCKISHPPCLSNLSPPGCHGVGEVEAGESVFGQMSIFLLRSLHLKQSQLSFPPTRPVYWLLGGEQPDPIPFGNIVYGKQVCHERKRQALECLPSGWLICQKGQKVGRVLMAVKITRCGELPWHKDTSIPSEHQAWRHTSHYFIMTLPLPLTLSDHNPWEPNSQEFHPGKESSLGFSKCLLQNHNHDSVSHHRVISHHQVPGVKHEMRQTSHACWTTLGHDTTLRAESEEELKGLLIRVKKESQIAGLKLKFQKMKIMAFSPITLCQIDGEIMETETDFIFLGSKN